MYAGSPAGISDRLVRHLRYRWARYHYRNKWHPLRRARIRRAELAAHSYFSSTEGRRKLIQRFRQSGSTGASMIDYHVLHRYVMVRRPARILEFGSGVTTLVMAHALAEIRDQRPDCRPGHIFSIEDIPKYHDDVVNLIPASLAEFVTPLLSEKRESHWRGHIWGFHYADLPSGPFDFAFVDGPTESKAGRKGACLDLLHVLENQPHWPLDVLVDQKFSSLDAYQSVLPHRRVRYDPVTDTGVIAGVCGSELLTTISAAPARLPLGNAWRMLGIGERAA